jgi:hypothetical protein
MSSLYALIKDEKWYADEVSLLDGRQVTQQCCLKLLLCSDKKEKNCRKDFEIRK